MAEIGSFGLGCRHLWRAGRPGHILRLAQQAEDDGVRVDLGGRSHRVPGDLQIEVPLQRQGRFPDPPRRSADGAGRDHGRARRRHQARTHRRRRADHALPQPVLLARMMVTLDQFSGGRIVLGAGVGLARGGVQCPRCLRLQEARPRHRRVPRDLQGDLGRRRGRAIAARPTPSRRSSRSPGSVQRPHPPILIGGLSDAALRRVCEARQRLAGSYGRSREAARRASSPCSG